MIAVNGKEYQWQESQTIEELLISLDFKINQVLIRVNNRFMDQSEYKEYVILDGMDIKIFNVMSGG